MRVDEMQRAKVGNVPSTRAEVSSVFHACRVEKPRMQIGIEREGEGESREGAVRATRRVFVYRDGVRRGDVREDTPSGVSFYLHGFHYR